MNPSLFISDRRRHVGTEAVDAWVLAAFAMGVAAPGAVALHLRRCPGCRRRAAGAWRFLAAAEADLPPPISEPDLSFLPPARPTP